MYIQYQNDWRLFKLQRFNTLLDKSRIKQILTFLQHVRIDEHEQGQKPSVYATGSPAVVTERLCPSKLRQQVHSLIVGNFVHFQYIVHNFTGALRNLLKPCDHKKFEGTNTNICTLSTFSMCT